MPDEREMSDTIKWGVLGTGYAARQFAEGLRFVQGSKLVAVGSRSVENAERFTHEFRVTRACSSYTQLVESPDIDVVFIATPNNRHKQDCLQALNANKSVVCEKPFALNAGEACEVIDLARRKNLFCMEGMWTRFMPVMPAVRQMLARGDIGDVSLLTAVLGHRITIDPANSLFDPVRGGGALLDLGVYTVSLATYLLGSSATVVSSEAIIGTTGVDEQCAMTLRFPDACTAMLSATLRASPSSELTLAGSEGCIRIHAPLYRPEFVSISHNPNPRRGHTSGMARYFGKFMRQKPVASPDEITEFFPVVGNGSNYQAAAAAACMREGRGESDVMPLADSLRTMEILDSARAHWSQADQSGNTGAGK
jgi:predicted dehydrogenase